MIGNSNGNYKYYERYRIIFTSEFVKETLGVCKDNLPLNIIGNSRNKINKVISFVKSQIYIWQIETYKTNRNIKRNTLLMVGVNYTILHIFDKIKRKSLTRESNNNK